MSLKFPHHVITCIPRDGYVTGRAQSTYNLRALKGRARYRLRDTYPSYHGGLNLDLSRSQFATWKGFYASLNWGTLPFLMDLDVGLGIEERTCHLMSRPQEVSLQNHRWQVQVELEVYDQ